MKGWKTVLFGALMATAPALLNYLAGVHWTDYVSPEWAGVIVGVIVVALRAVTNTPIGTDKTIIKILIFALVVSLFLPSDARAGDLSGPAAINKALTAPVAPCQLATATTPLSCSGLYVGAGIAGQGSNADIIGSGINGSVFAGGIVPSLDFGYQYVQGNWLFGAEVDAGYSINNSAQINGVGNGFNGFRLSEVFKVGGNASALLGNQAPITIPPQLANAVIAPYGHISPTQWQLPGSWAAGTGSGAGVEFDFGPRIWGDLRYTYTDFHGAKALGVTIQNDQSLRFSVNYKLN